MTGLVELGAVDVGGERHRDAVTQLLLVTQPDLELEYNQYARMLDSMCRTLTSRLIVKLSPFN